MANAPFKRMEVEPATSTNDQDGFDTREQNVAKKQKPDLARQVAGLNIDDIMPSATQASAPELYIHKMLAALDAKRAVIDRRQNPNSLDKDPTIVTDFLDTLTELVTVSRSVEDGTHYLRPRLISLIEKLGTFVLYTNPAEAVMFLFLSFGKPAGSTIIYEAQVVLDEDLKVFRATYPYPGIHCWDAAKQVAAKKDAKRLLLVTIMMVITRAFFLAYPNVKAKDQAAHARLNWFVGGADIPWLGLQVALQDHAKKNPRRRHRSNSRARTPLGRAQTPGKQRFQQQQLPPQQHQPRRR